MGLLDEILNKIFKVEDKEKNILQDQEEEVLLGQIERMNEKGIDKATNKKELAIDTQKRKEIGKSAKLLCFLDLHYVSDENLAKLREISPTDYDIILCCGDNRFDYLYEINHVLEGNKYGILGNHDKWDVLDNENIENIHGEVIEVNGIKIAGFQGSNKYKSKDYPSFTQEESQIEADKIPRADILISHTSPYGIYGEEDTSHIGLRGITKYIVDNDVKLNIHGHYHTNTNTVLEDGTVILGLQGAVIIDTTDYSIRRIF
jgi:Icc-related predicted phosphoesterase